MPSQLTRYRNTQYTIHPTLKESCSRIQARMRLRLAASALPSARLTLRVRLAVAALHRTRALATPPPPMSITSPTPLTSPSLHRSALGHVPALCWAPTLLLLFMHRLPWAEPSPSQAQPCPCSPIEPCTHATCVVSRLTCSLPCLLRHRSTISCDQIVSLHHIAPSRCCPCCIPALLLLVPCPSLVEPVPYTTSLSHARATSLPCRSSPVLVLAVSLVLESWFSN